MMRRMLIFLASAMLAGSLLATDAQARGGGGGHIGGGHIGGMGGLGGHVGGLGAHMGGLDGHIGGFEGAHLGAGNRIDSLDLGTNHIDTSHLGMRHSPDRRFGGEGFDYDADLYDDGLGCSDLGSLHMYRRWRPGCS